MTNIMWTWLSLLVCSQHPTSSQLLQTVQWMATHNHGVDFLQHYLDDFLTLGPPASPVFYNNLQTCIQLYTKLGLPLHPDKLEEPCTCLSTLGIELDSSTLQAWLPPQKRERIIALLGTYGLVSIFAGSMNWSH